MPSYRDEKRILIVTPEFPPAGGSGVLRMIGFTRALADKGWSVSVLTVPESGSNELVEYIPESTKIVRAAERSLGRFLRGLRASRGSASAPAPSSSPTKTQQPPTPAKRNAVKASLLKWSRKLDSLLYPPTGCSGWCKPAIKAGRPLTEDVDVIFSSFGPDSSHMVARRLARESGKPWVADFRDPYADNPGIMARCVIRAYRRLVRRYERAFVQEASHVITTTDTLAETFVEKYQISAEDDVSVISNGYDADIFGPIPPRRDVGDRFVLSFLGNAYGSESFIPFLQGVAKFISTQDVAKDRFVLQFVGGASGTLKNAVAELGIEDSVELVPRLNHHEAIEHMRKSTAQVVIREEQYEKLCIPGKVYQYMLANRPILCIANDSPLRELCRTHNLGPCAGLRDSDAIAAALAGMFALHEKGELDDHWIHHGVEQYSRHRLGAELDEVLRRVLSKHAEQIPSGGRNA